MFESRSTVGNKPWIKPSSIHDNIYPCNGDLHIGDLCENGSQLRPNIVWFGESLPPEKLSRAVTLAEEADFFVIVGTSLEVYPAAALIKATKEMCQIYYVDPGDFNMSLPAVKRAFVSHVKELATTGVPKVIAEIKSL